MKIDTITEETAKELLGEGDAGALYKEKVKLLLRLHSTMLVYQDALQSIRVVDRLWAKKVKQVKAAKTKEELDMVAAQSELRCNEWGAMVPVHPDYFVSEEASMRLAMTSRKGPLPMEAVLAQLELVAEIFPAYRSVLEI